MKIINNIKDLNRSKTYLLPLIYNQYNLLFLDNICNTYIKFSNLFFEKYSIPTERRLMGILYENMNTVRYQEYFLKLEQHKNFIKMFILDDYILVILEIEENIFNEYDSFIRGKYSKFSPSSKRLILEFYSNNFRDRLLCMDIKDVLYQSLSKREKLEKELGIKLPPDTELASVTDIENETFKLEITQ